MYRNFICYRGGSSAGILFAEDIYKRVQKEENIDAKEYESALKIGAYLLSEDAKQLKELAEL